MIDRIIGSVWIISILKEFSKSKTFFSGSLFASEHCELTP